MMNGLINLVDVMDWMLKNQKKFFNCDMYIESFEWDDLEYQNLLKSKLIENIAPNHIQNIIEDILEDIDSYRVIRRNVQENYWVWEDDESFSYAKIETSSNSEAVINNNNMVHCYRYVCKYSKDYNRQKKLKMV